MLSLRWLTGLYYWNEKRAAGVALTYQNNYQSIYGGLLNEDSAEDTFGSTRPSTPLQDRTKERRRKQNTNVTFGGFSDSSDDDVNL